MHKQSVLNGETDTNVLAMHKKSYLKHVKEKEDDMERGITQAEIEARDKKEKEDRDRKALKIKLTAEQELLCKIHRIDPTVYGNETAALLEFIEEERIVFDERKAQERFGYVEPPPSRSTGFKEARPLGDKWKTNNWGGDGRFNEVAMKSAAEERKYRYDHLGGRDDSYDPFYDCSVRDTLEQSHFDGYHTIASSSVAPSAAPTFVTFGGGGDGGSVVSMISMNSGVVSNNSYQTANTNNTNNVSRVSKASSMIPPVLPVYFMDAINVIPGAREKLHEVALDESRNRHGKSPKKKLTPYENPPEYSKFCKNGTFLNDYGTVVLNNDIDKALSKHKEVQTEAMMVEGYDPALIQKFGGEQRIEKLTKDLVDYSVKVRGQAARRGAFLDFSADFVEACNRFNLTKVIALLYKGDADPNTVMNESEPLFTHLVVKALSMDAIANTIHVADAPETGDRLVLQKILNEFVKYEVDINICRGNGLTALHTASQAGNSKVVKWLLDNRANPRLKSKREEMTPLMFACKYGHVQAMSELVRKLGADCLKETDPNGFTSLHFSAATGQTQACIFLLDIGADKRALDVSLRTAARVAQDSKFMATSQAISCHAYGRTTGQSYLSYVEKQMRADDASSLPSEAGFAQRFWQTIGGVGTAVAAGFQNMFRRRSSADKTNAPKPNRGGLLYQLGHFIYHMFTPIPPPTNKPARVVPISIPVQAADKSAAVAVLGNDPDGVMPFEEESN
jgi:hypothetical protein